MVERHFPETGGGAQPKHCRRRLAAVCLSALAWAGTARAQEAGADRGGNVSVLERPHPELDPLGVSIGAFTYFPAVEFGVDYNDNILATDTRALSDAIFTTTPRIDVRSNWSQNSIGLKADGIFSRYQTYPSQDSNQFGVAAEGRLDVYHDLTVTAEAGYAYRVYPRTADAYYQITVIPLLYGEASAKVDVVKVFDRVKLTVAGAYDQFRYSDGLAPGGAIIDEAFRNYDLFSPRLRGDYAISPAVGLFLEEVVNNFSYVTATGRNTLSSETLMGTTLELTHLFSGEIGAGYFTATYDNPLATPIGNLDFRADLRYFPTQLITIGVKAHEGLVDSGLPGAPNYLQKTVEASADYELLRSLIISSVMSVDFDDYRAVDRHDTILDWRLEGTYRLNRVVALELAYDRVQRSSTGAQAGRNFVDNVARLSITFRR